MAGARIRIKIDDAAARAALDRLAKAGAGSCPATGGTRHSVRPGLGTNPPWRQTRGPLFAGYVRSLRSHRHGEPGKAAPAGRRRYSDRDGAASGDAVPAVRPRTRIPCYADDVFGSERTS